MKAVAASRHKAIMENQVVEACFVAMVVTGCPVIELLDDDDDEGLDVAFGEARVQLLVLNLVWHLVLY
jgi:hypothetical protein